MSSPVFGSELCLSLPKPAPPASVGTELCLFSYCDQSCVLLGFSVGATDRFLGIALLALTCNGDTYMKDPFDTCTYLACALGFEVDKTSFREGDHGSHLIFY